MKNIYQKIRNIVAVVAVMFCANASVGQTSVTINYLYDSLAITCPTPAQVQLTYNVSTNNYNWGTDDLDVYVSFGDGSDTTWSDGLYIWGLIDHTYNLPGQYTVTMIATGVDGNADTATYSIILSATCTVIDGYVYLDNNSNCVFDSGDDTMSYVPISAIDQTTGNFVGYGYANQNGYYNFTVASGVAIDLVAFLYAPPATGYTVQCPSSGQYSFTTSGSVSSYNFGFSCINSQFDLSTTLSGWGFVPGNNGVVHAAAYNSGCLPVSGSLTITSNNPLVTFTGNNYIPGGNLPASFTPGSITYNFSNLSAAYAYWWNAFGVHPEVYTDTTATIGDTVCFTITVSPSSGDINPVNNVYTVCMPVLSSYDPNMKDVYPAGAGATGDVLPNTTFTYTVHFQNTGNYPATDVYILDTIDTDLNMTTLEILGSSHPMNPIVFGGNKIKFDFPNINLIDSTTNEPLSHGWVTYRIKCNTGLSIGTQIENTAHIFFDYNPAVVTNTTLNTISVVGVDELQAIENTMYPNPVNDELNIQFNQTVSGVMQIRDMAGRVVYTRALKNVNTYAIPVANWNAGMYEISITGAPLTNQRFVVAHK